MTKTKCFEFLKRLMVALGLLGIILGILGGHWDGWFHVENGHELLAAPHIVILAGLFAFGLCGLASAMILKTEEQRLPFSEKRGLKLVFFGGILTPLALVMDELWHKFINLDMTAWSLPHVLMFIGVACILFGLAVFLYKKEKGFNFLTVIFFATLLMLALFSLQDFDQPSMSFVSEFRPGFVYPFVLTGVVTFILLTISAMTGRPGYATLAAIIGWVFHAGSGQLVGYLGGFYHTFPSFPVIVPALALDLAILTRGRLFSDFPNPFMSLLFCALTVSSVCFWAVIGWATFYTKLPQQISGNFGDWFLWYVAFAPLFSFFCAIFISLILKWSLNRPYIWTKTLTQYNIPT